MLNKQEQIEVIAKVVKNHKNKGFDIFSDEDIEQEAWIIVLEKIHLFDYNKSKQKNEKKAFEHWLNKILANRLTNFYRDNYLVKQRLTKSKKGNKPHNLLSPLDISAVNDKNLVLHDVFDDIELLGLLVVELTDEMKEVLDALLSGEDVGSYYRHKLYQIIKELINKGWPHNR